MCDFFSAIVTKKLEIFFCEKDSHEDILERMDKSKVRKSDQDSHIRAEVSPESWKLQIDSHDMTDWVERNYSKIEGDMVATAKKIQKLRRKRDTEIESLPARRVKVKKPEDPCEREYVDSWVSPNMDEFEGKFCKVSFEDLTGKGFYMGGWHWDNRWVVEEKPKRRASKRIEDIIEEYSKALSKIEGYLPPKA